MLISESLSNKVANMSFVCACLIVWTHTSALTGDPGIKGVLTSIAVPSFFVISGFFLGLRIDENGWYPRAVRKRVRTLVVPFFVLNILWWPIKYGIHYVGVRYFGASDALRTMDVTFCNFLSQTGFIPWGGNAVQGLWYLKALFLLVCLSPVLVWFVRRGMAFSIFLLVILLGCWCVQARVEWLGRWDGLMTFELSMRCPFYLTVGLILSHYADLVLCRWQRAVFVVLAIAGIVLALRFGSRCWGCPLVSVGIVAVIGAGVWSVLPACRWPNVLVGNAFAVFVFHGSILYVIEALCKALHCGGFVFGRLGLLPVVCLVVGFAILLAEGMRRRFPRFAALIFGGR